MALNPEGLRVEGHGLKTMEDEDLFRTFFLENIFQHPHFSPPSPLTLATTLHSQYYYAVHYTDEEVLRGRGECLSLGDRISPGPNYSRAPLNSLPA